MVSYLSFLINVDGTRIDTEQSGGCHEAEDDVFSDVLSIVHADAL